MNLQSELNKATLFQNLELLAKQVVEGFISGIHKSPFHGFSAEFAEHKIYNNGESTKHIDWKLFAKTDKLYTKRYEEETNLRCHIILDNSASMYYPEVKELSVNNLNKIGFGVLATAALMNILKKQRDAVGLSVYSDSYNYYVSEKSSERHHQMLLAKLSALSTDKNPAKKTETYTYLHQIAEKRKRRSLIFLFTDMFQATTDNSKLFDALQHLKHNKHEFVLFHTFDGKLELDFDFDKVLEQSKDNPVFYVQYANARVNSVLRKAKDAGIDLAATPDLTQLSHEAEIAVAKKLAEWPRMVSIAARTNEPHRISFYLYDLASEFHALWNKGNDLPELRFLQDGSDATSVSKIALARSVQVVICAGLGILGVEPVEEMR